MWCCMERDFYRASLKALESSLNAGIMRYAAFYYSFTRALVCVSVNKYVATTPILPRKIDSIELNDFSRLFGLESVMKISHAYFAEILETRNTIHLSFMKFILFSEKEVSKEVQKS